MSKKTRGTFWAWAQPMRRRYVVAVSLICWAHNRNGPWTNTKSHQNPTKRKYFAYLGWRTEVALNTITYNLKMCQSVGHWLVTFTKHTRTNRMQIVRNHQLIHTLCLINTPESGEQIGDFFCTQIKLFVKAKSFSLRRRLPIRWRICFFGIDWKTHPWETRQW